MLLPDEIILRIAFASKLSSNHLIRIMRTCRQFNAVMRDDNLWRRFVPEKMRYRPNLFNEYTALMKSNAVPPLIKFLVTKKGMTYDQARCVRIRDPRVVQKVVNAEMTLDEAKSVMTLSVKLRDSVLNKEVSLSTALQLNIPTIEKFYSDIGFTETLTLGSVLHHLLNDPRGIQMLLEGLIDPTEYNQWRGGITIAHYLVRNPHVLTALREGLVTGSQIIQMREEMDAPYFIEVIFSEDSLQALRLGHVTPEEAIACMGRERPLKEYERRVNSITCNYFDKAMSEGSFLIVWLKQNPNFVLHAGTLFSHVNGWKLYSQKIFTLNYLLQMPSIEFLKFLIENNEIVEALLAKQISLDQLLILKTVTQLDALANLSGNYWLEKVIDGTITTTLLSTLECSFQELNKLRWSCISLIEGCGKTVADLLRDTNCEFEHLVTLDGDDINRELERIIPETEMQRFRSATEKDLEIVRPAFYRYLAQAIGNLTINMRMQLQMH